MADIAIAPDPPLPGEDEELELHDELLIEGDGQLSLTIGGKKPTVSKMVIRGGQIPFSGEAKKGDHLTLRIRGRVAAIHVTDTIDVKTRDVVETTRKHVLRIEGAELLLDEA